MNFKLRDIAALVLFFCLFTNLNTVYGQIRPGATQKAKKEKKPVNNGQLFDKLDLNKDGKVTRAEAVESNNAPLKDNFDNIDTNKSGDLSRDEIKNAHKHMKPKSAMSKSKQAAPANVIDTNSDKKYSRSEVNKSSSDYYKLNFVKIDTNKDGFLTAIEISTFKRAQTKTAVKKK